MKRGYSLSFLAELTGGKLEGEDLIIKGINSLRRAKEDEISFIENERFLEDGEKTQAKALIVSFRLKDRFSSKKSLLLVENVRLAVAKISSLFAKTYIFLKGVSENAFIEDEVRIGKNVVIYPGVYLQKGVVIEDEVIIYPGVFVGAFSKIGKGTVIFPNAVIYPLTEIGKGCIIHAGSVIGSDGFGYAQEIKGEGFRHHKIYHFGKVVIKDDVEIGANTTIDRAVFEETLIEENTKIDNLVQIGHNVEIGKSCILVGQVGISGSVVVEDYVMMAGQVGVAPYSHIGKGAKIGAKSGVSGRIPPGEEVIGIPAINARIWKRAAVIFTKLPEIYQLFKKLKKNFKNLNP